MMKLKGLLIAVSCLLMAGPVTAEDDVMITRDGSMMTVKVEKISSSQVTFIDLKHKKRGRLNAPADFVYMIMKEKGNNIFFDEEGNQTTSPVVKFDKKDNVMFLNRGEMFVIYNVSVGRDEVVYQLKDKKKAPQYKINKDEVFMIRNSDGTATLYNDSYQKRQKEQQATAPPNTALAVPTIPTKQTTTSATSAPATTTAPAATVQVQAPTGQQLLASSTTETGFAPAPNMNAEEIELKVNAINPYTLYRKGSVAEYCFQYKGKQTQYIQMGPTYVQQIVADEKIENGLLVAYIQQVFLNKKHEPSKGVSATFMDYYFPTEIDTAGTFHFTHNILQDLYMITKRQGYGILVPGNMSVGMNLQSSILHDESKNMLGNKIKTQSEYTGWSVVGEEAITVPAGTFYCVKLTGRISQRDGENGSPYGQQQVTCWMSKGVGIVQYERILDSDKSREPFIMYLNKLELK